MLKTCNHKHKTKVGHSKMIEKGSRGIRPKIQNLQSAQVTGLNKFQTRYALVEILCKGLVDVYGFIFFDINSSFSLSYPSLKEGSL